MLGCVKCALASYYPPLPVLALEARIAHILIPLTPELLSSSRIPFKDDYPVVIRSGARSRGVTDDASSGVG